MLIKDREGYDWYEIKSASTFHPDFTKGLKNFGRNYPTLLRSKTVVYSGNERPDFEGIRIIIYSTLETTGGIFKSI